MGFELAAVLAIGFGLGLKHAMEPDHVIAVSTIASQSKTLWRSALAGVFWGIGHTATLFIVGMALILMKGGIPEKSAMTLEFLVGIMLVYLGLKNLFVPKRRASHHHPHPSEMKRSYLQSTVIGFIHGLAGSAAMALLAMASVDTKWEGVLYILIFGIGTMLGMLLCTTLIGLPFVLGSKNAGLRLGISRGTGLISTFFGLYYMYQIGIREGLLQMWFPS